MTARRIATPRRARSRIKTIKRSPNSQNIAFYAAAPVFIALDFSRGNSASPSDSAATERSGPDAAAGKIVQTLQSPASPVLLAASRETAAASTMASLATDAFSIEQKATGAPDAANQHTPALAATKATVKTQFAGAPTVSQFSAEVGTDTEKQAADPAPSQSGVSASVQESGDSAAPVRLSAAADSSPAGKRDGASSHDRSSGDERSGASAARSSETGLALPADAGSSSVSAPSQQIFEAIKSAAPQASSAAALADESQTALASLQPVKTLSLALTPQNLGSVSIELSLKAGKLDVKVTAAEPETAKLLQRDDAALGSLLQSAGYSVQSISIQVSAQASQTASQQAQTGQSFPDSSTANSGGREQSNRRGSNEQPANSGSDQRPTHGRTASYSGGGSLYV